jgi:predicted DNA-binding transcriptional regulator AlpA
MSTQDFITELFCRVDDMMQDVVKHPQSSLHPSEVVTLGLLFAFKGVGNRAFYRWIKRDYLPLFPHLPERTRLFRLFAFAAAAHREWTNRFLAEPTIMGASDTYGIELIHPIREGRSPRQIGRKGLSNRRWIEGVKLALVVNQWGLAVGWDSDTANHKDNIFRPLVAQYEERMVVLTDTGFHTTPKKGGDPSNMKVCQPNTWNERMVIEDVFAMLTTVCHLKKIGHRVWAYVRARLAFVVAAFNLLTQWNGLQPDEAGVVHLSIAQFSL